jgi:hypothetical protein
MDNFIKLFKIFICEGLTRHKKVINSFGVRYFLLNSQ